MVSSSLLVDAKQIELGCIAVWLGGTIIAFDVAGGCCCVYECIWALDSSFNGL